MKDSKTGSCPNHVFAAPSGLLGSSPKASSAIELNCLGARRPTHCQPVPAEVL